MPHCAWNPPVSHNIQMCVVSHASATGKIEELFIDAAARLKRDAAFSEVEQRRHKLVFKVDSIAQNNNVAAINRWPLSSKLAGYHDNAPKNANSMQCNAQKTFKRSCYDLSTCLFKECTSIC